MVGAITDRKSLVPKIVPVVEALSADRNLHWFCMRGRMTKRNVLFKGIVTCFRDIGVK